MMIWSSTPVPMAASIPAIAARSMFQWVTDATPRMSISSAILVTIIGITSKGDLYLMKTITAITRSANSPAIRAPFLNWLPSSADTASIPTIETFTGRAPDCRTT